MRDRYLYLLGGHSFQKETNRQFVEQAGGSNARIVLCIMNRPGWEEYVPLFQQMWTESGARDMQVIVPDEDGILDMEQAEQVLSQATGIFIGGGNTEKYHHYYATGRFKDLLINCYENGVPIAGNSAGALILPEICLISPLDNEQSVMLFKQGVGLLSNVLISVHYTEWSDQSNLLEGMRTKKVKRGIGIDEQACAVFINGQLAYALGESVHEVIFEDFDPDQYTIVKGQSHK
ncbi:MULTISPECIES: cyanophycinase [Paenibacillus]|uniref:Peptidase S51 n=1 Tax=Paenibacillus lautus TaxID=1401 RepID=A0A1R1AW33_PAELA|nr:cyanophycinase [Paenibacillus lautus]OME89712.1 peptidase S51 [Paenibacillus lautus]